MRVEHTSKRPVQRSSSTLPFNVQHEDGTLNAPILTGNHMLSALQLRPARTQPRPPRVETIGPRKISFSVAVRSCRCHKRQVQSFSLTQHLFSNLCVAAKRVFHEFARKAGPEFQKAKIVNYRRGGTSSCTRTCLEWCSPH